MSAIDEARAMRADDIALSAALAGASMRTRLAVNALLAEPLTDADLTVVLTLLSRHVEGIDYNAEQPLTPSTRLAISVANALMPARWLSKLEALPPSM